MGRALAIRVVSALIGILVIALLTYWYQSLGLIYLSCSVILAVVFEFSRLIYSQGSARESLCWLFRVLGLCVAGTMIFWPFLALPAFVLSAVIMASASIVVLRRSQDLHATLTQIGFAVTGLIYCGLFGGMVVALLSLPLGVTWYLGYISMVFAGDTFAYFFGKTWGNRKLIPTISPQKTIAGAWGGILGSSLVAVILWTYFLPAVPLQWLLLTAIFTAVFAQIGDIFESLVKRVAQVKDSGRMMPGHGGLLDRVDGVFFAAPVFYLAASYFSAVY